MLHKHILTEIIHSLDACAVKLNDIVALDKLIYAVEIVHSPCVLVFRRKQVLTKSHVSITISKITQQGRHNVNLLCDAVSTTRFYLTRGIIDNYWRTETSQIRAILLMIHTVCMVARYHEYSVLEPRLLTCLSEELTKCMIGIANTSVDRIRAVILIHILIFLRNSERMM